MAQWAFSSLTVIVFIHEKYILKVSSGQPFLSNEPARSPCDPCDLAYLTRLTGPCYSRTVEPWTVPVAPPVNSPPALPVIQTRCVADYDPEGAEALLDEAGYPRGADGTRFKTVMVHLERYDLNYVQLVASYWKRIGVDVDPQVHPLALMVSRRSERDFEMINAEAAGRWFPLAVQQRYTTAAPWNISNVDNPWYEAKFLEGAAATTIEEQNNISQ